MNNLFKKIKAIFYKLSTKEQMFFVKRLSFLVAAGMPLLQSLLMLEGQMKSKKTSKMISFLIQEVSAGQFLSTSLRRLEQGFDHFSINIISIGESVGILSKNLEYLAEELKKRDMLRKKIVGAFIYPIIVFLATILMTAFIITYLFPKITPIFKNLKATLPLSTRIIIFVSDFLTNNGLYLCLFLSLFSFLVFWFFVKNKHFSKKIYYFAIRTPLLGEIIISYNLSRITRSIGLLLKSDLILSESVHITTSTIKNPLYREEFERITQKIMMGEFISPHLKNSKLFPDVFHQVIFVGEQSGNLSDSFIYLSDFYENEVNEWSKNISNLVEPVLMIVMGLLVGFVAISIISPIYGITQNLGQK